MKFRVLTVLMALALSAVVTAQTPTSPEGLLKSAIHREVIDGDIAGAIQQYKDIVARYPANRPVAAGALLRLGGLYEKQGKDDARDFYQRILNEYADTGAPVTTARARLAALQPAPLPFNTRDFSPIFSEGTRTRFVFSPDGKYLSYSKPGLNGLWLLEIASGKESTLGVRPDEAPYSIAVWAPDAKHLVIAMRAAAPEFLDHRLISVPGGESRVIATVPRAAGGSFSWSPDSKRLAFLTRTQSGPMEVHVYALSSRQEPPVSLGVVIPAGTVQWSPDSSRMAFLTPTATTGAYEIRTVDVTTREAKSIQLPAPATLASRFVLQNWTSTNQIRFRQMLDEGGDDYLVDASGGTPRLSCESRGGFGGDGCQGLSPDGTLQIVRRNASGGGRIVLKNLKTGEERPLTNEAVLQQTAGGFSPDGKLFAFRSNRDGKWAMYVVPVDRIPVTNPLKIADLQEGQVLGSWAGHHLDLRMNESQINVFRIDLDSTGHATGSVARLTQDRKSNIQPAISPDGLRVAYISNDGQQRGFYLMEANGQRERLLFEIQPNRLSRMTLLGWRSNDELLVSDQGNAQTTAVGPAPRQLLVLNLTTKQMTPLAIPPLGRGDLRYVPGDNAVIFNAANGMQRYRSVPAGTERDLVMPKVWDEFIVSNDGRLMAYSQIDRSVPNGKPMPAQLRVRNVDGSNDRVVATFADSKDRMFPLAWSPNGKYILFQDPGLLPSVVNVETGTSWPLVTAPPSGVLFDFPAVSWSADGSFIVMEGTAAQFRWNRIEDITLDSVLKLMGGRK